MIKLNVGICRKVGRPDYGSDGASVNLEIELGGDLPDTAALLGKIKALQAVAVRAVNEQLRSGMDAPPPAEPTPPPASAPAPGPARNGTTPPPRRAPDPLPADQRTNVNGRFKGLPRSGNALFAWLKDQQQDANVNLVAWLDQWAHDMGFPKQYKQWDEGEVRQGVAAVQEAIRGLAAAANGGG